MMVIDVHKPDWISIRQSLSLALLKNLPITIGGGGFFLAENPDYRPIFNNIACMAEEFDAGQLQSDRESIIFEPRPLKPGKFRFDSGHTSSAVELLMFLMPSLFYLDFRSILDIGGVTHSPLSCPTSFVKETLLAALEQMGLYGSLTLQRFGFHGSGGGAMEARLYPREERSGAPLKDGRVPGIDGVKIFISHLDTGLAEIEKKIIAETIAMDTDRIAIIEVMESDGPGNGIQVFASCKGLPVVLFREMKLYNEKGGLSFSEETLRSEIAGLAAETRLLMEGTLPERAVRELYPYYLVSGTGPVPAEESPGIAMTRDLCGKLLG